jgi:DNA mismatch repair ATPase MutS
LQGIIVVKFCLTCEKLQIADELSAAFAKLPDLERILSRIHTGGCKVVEFVRTIDALDALLVLHSDLVFGFAVAIAF